MYGWGATMLPIFFDQLYWVLGQNKAHVATKFYERRYRASQEAF